MNRKMFRVLPLFLIVALIAPIVHAQMTTNELLDYWLANSDLGVLDAGGSLTPEAVNYTIDVLAKAEPDECFSGIPPMGPPYPANPTNNPPPACADGGQPKVNQAYVWGLTRAESNLWFGTAANVHLLVMGGYLGSTNPIQTESYVGEFGHSYYSQVLGVPGIVGDWRPPRIFMYDTGAGQLLPKDTLAILGPVSAQRLRLTLGIRSAGTWPGNTSNNPFKTVFLAGPTMSTNGGINIFAYNAEEGTLMGSATLPQYSNIRRWLLHDGVLYCAVGNTNKTGHVLKWQSNPAAPGYPFAFEIVGDLDGDGADLVAHEGRIFAGTWPNFRGGSPVAPASMWMSPVVPAGGLTPAHTATWTKVWSAADYEPDPVVAATYGMGAMASYQGYIYFGSMNVPGMSLAAHEKVYGEPSSTTIAFLGTHRPIQVFRGKNFDAPGGPTLHLLYGAKQLPVYNPAVSGWVLVNNKMGGVAPLFGQQGFGNLFNNYTWSMEILDDELYVGTMDFSHLVWDMLPEVLDASDLLLVNLYLSSMNVNMDNLMGADLFRFRSKFFPAATVNRRGVGNYTSYGVRNMATDGKTLFLGMANPMNLLTDLTDDKPEGGWELLALQKKTGGINDYNGDGLSDLAVYQKASGAWFIRKLGPGPAIVFGDPTWGNSDMIPVEGDFNADGISDQALYDLSTGYWFIKTVGGVPITIGELWGGKGLVPVSGDYDGDGADDLAVYDTTTGDWFIKSLFNPLPITFGQNWGNANTIPVAGDYNNDGISDLAVYDVSTGNWYIRSLGPGAPLAFGQNWGGAGLSPVYGDYNKDGVSDLAVYQQATGNWYIRSLGPIGPANPPITFGQNWGNANTAPVPGDYNADGLSDLSVFDQITGNWYIRSLGPGAPIAFGQNWGNNTTEAVGDAK